MIRLDDILDRVSAKHENADLDTIRKAYVFSAKVHKGQTRLSGEPYLVHPMEVANILVDMDMDEATIAAGLLHDTVEDTLTTVSEIEGIFGGEIAEIVDGLTKISRFSFKTSEERQAENFRKMLLATTKDLRIIMIKLADRLHNMKTLAFMSEKKQLEIAQETIDIYAPLANRLGMAKVKAELEDLSFKYLKPAIYDELAKKVVKKRTEREDYTEEVKNILAKKMAEFGLECEVFGRLKHLYSIYQKMEEQRIDIEQVYDLIGFRIIFESIKDCYAALGIVHSLWKPVPGRVKDYIAMPKANMYQSLHTTVIGPRGERVEIQRRTREMHEIAENGIAAHWIYKEKDKTALDDENYVRWLRQLTDLQKDIKDPSEFIEALKLDLFPNDVFVFTPKGEVREFPRGATPVDFAYSIHTDIGHSCVGAKINGKIVPLRYQLQNGDTVSIITSSNHHPSKDWLKFVKTSKARSRINQWIKTVERERGIEIGREIIEKELKRFDISLQKLIKSGEVEHSFSSIGVSNLNDLFVAVGFGKIGIRNLLHSILPKDRHELLDEIHPPQKKRVKSGKTSDTGTAITIEGADDVMIKFGKCCSPIPGDKVAGYISRGKGVVVHSVNCKNIMGYDPARKINVEWNPASKVLRPAYIEVVCTDEKGLLSAMSGTITAMEANISNATIRTTRDKKAVNDFEIQVTDNAHLMRVIRALENTKGVLSVSRIRK